jgi:hypothetical protein
MLSPLARSLSPREPGGLAAATPTGGVLLGDDSRGLILGSTPASDDLKRCTKCGQEKPTIYKGQGVETDIDAFVVDHG